MPEVIPELVYVVGLFFAVVGYLTARGLLATWTHSLGYVFSWLAAHLRFHPSVGGLGFTLDLGGPFKAIDSWVVTALQNWCDGAEIEMGYCLHGMAKVAHYTAQAIDWLARETDASLDWLTHVAIPKVAKGAAVVALPYALLRKWIAEAVAAAVAHTLKIIHTTTHDVTHTTTIIVRKVVGAAEALPGWVTHLPSRVRGLEREEGRLAHRLRKVEGIFAASVAAAVIANALGIATRCLRRGNVGKAARSICGFDPSLIESLLADGLAIVGVLSVVEFATELRAIEDDAVKILGALVKEWPS